VIPLTYPPSANLRGLKEKKPQSQNYALSPTLQLLLRAALFYTTGAPHLRQPYTLQLNNQNQNQKRQGRTHFITITIDTLQLWMSLSAPASRQMTINISFRLEILIVN
jgi:hypothetical protein